MKIRLKYSLILFILIASFCSVSAQHERSKDFNESWNNIRIASVEHRHGALQIIPHSGDEVKLEAHILVHARDANAAQVLIDHFEIKNTVSDGKLVITTKFHTRNWTSSNNNIKIKFEDGSKVSGIRKIEIKFKLHVPALELLTLSNKYNNIEITDDYSGDVIIKQYDGTVRTQSVDGSMDINLKYGKALIGSIGNLKMDIYDSYAEITKAEEVTIKSKYSKIKIGEIESAIMNSYDGYCEIKSVAGKTEISDKYSSYDIGSAHDIQANMYDGKLRLAQAVNYSGTSKYTAFELTNIENITLKSSFDDNYSIHSVSTFKCEDSKYTSYKIENISNELNITSAFDDDINVSSVGKTFNNFEIDCKYTTVKLPLNSILGYTINAIMKYGKLSYDEPSENIVHKENSEQLELRAQVGAANAVTTVTINAYDSNIKLK